MTFQFMSLTSTGLIHPPNRRPSMPRPKAKRVPIGIETARRSICWSRRKHLIAGI